jgi:peptide/nickel transport system permease protein
VAFLGQNLPVIAGTIGVLSIPIYTRIARANTLSVAQREFVLAARAMGARNSRILFREILPNVVLPVMAFGLIAMGSVIVLEGALAFLGLSVELPQATWGGMISEGNRHIFDKVHVALIPSAVMFFTVLSLNFVGDTLRSRFDVRESNL